MLSGLLQARSPKFSSSDSRKSGLAQPGKRDHRGAQHASNCPHHGLEGIRAVNRFYAWLNTSARDLVLHGFVSYHRVIHRKLA
jgi:hypothetical protein